jgi:hypothetical protein
VLFSVLDFNSSKEPAIEFSGFGLAKQGKGVSESFWGKSYGPAHISRGIGENILSLIAVGKILHKTVKVKIYFERRFYLKKSGRKVLCWPVSTGLPN